MITRLNTSFLQTATAAGTWAVEQFAFAGSLGLLFAQAVGGFLMEGPAYDRASLLRW